MDLRLRAFPTHGPLPWAAVTAGIGAWTVHIVAGSALAPAACDHHSAIVAIHVLTAITALVTVGAMGVCWRMMRQPAGEHGSELQGGGHVRFLGVLGLLVNGISLMLILMEGGFVVAVHPCVR